MPHEPTPGPGSARPLIESASAFARREMLAEAHQALQDARAALALRSDVGPAHWCDACLVALEIAARGGDVPEMEAEAAQLRALSRGGRYWTEQARARIGGRAGRIDPARLHRVFAILAGEATPVAPHCGAPPIPVRASDAADSPVASSDHASIDLLPLRSVSTPGEGLAEESSSGWAERLEEVADDLQAALVQDRRHEAGLTDAPITSLSNAPLTAEIQPLDPLPLERAKLHGMESLRRTPIPSAESRALLRYRLWPQRMAIAARGPLVGLAAAICVYFVGAGLGVPFALPETPAAERAPRHGDATHALRTANTLGNDRASEPRKHLVRAQALLAGGDTVGAVAALVAAAQSDSRGAISWTAAETLARLPGRSAPAADAYLLAFAAGLPAGRAEIVAHAQELAGRPERAGRVREEATLGQWPQDVRH